jgi:hypothetical protein
MNKQIRYGKQVARVKSADGVEGMLIRSLGGKYLFRVYQSDGAFTDYVLRHSDLCVTIHDSDAAFYSVDERHVLDHAPATLGLEEVSENHHHEDEPTTFACKANHCKPFTNSFSTML